MQSSQKVDEYQELRKELLSDFFTFNCFFFKERTKREFLISKPVGQKSHFRIIAEELTNAFYGKYDLLVINCPPGYSKSTLLINFIAWANAWYPFSNHIYVSYSHELASSHTHTIKQIMTLPIYKKLFNVEITRDSSAKDFFKTVEGGTVAAFGTGGSITGRDAGLPGVEHYSGALIVDDYHKPKDVHSDTIRQKEIDNYEATLETRLRSPRVPVIAIGHRLHQADYFDYLQKMTGSKRCKFICIEDLDAAGNPTYPEVLPIEKINRIREFQPYVYASQYQQRPTAAGNALYKQDWFITLDEMPEIISSFITCDTAETDKTWNDKTVFSFWGLYKIKVRGVETQEYALHWLDCIEIQVEPHDLEREFLDFWANCMQFKVQPARSFIEKKSTGVTLISTLTKVQGLEVIAIDRTSKSGSKSDRFIAMQKYIAEKRITLPTYGKHTKMCIDHMTQITANEAHRWDDIADTCYDAVDATFITKTALTRIVKTDYTAIAKNLSQGWGQLDRLRKNAYASQSTGTR